MGKILLKTLLAFVFFLGLSNSYATHIVGGTLEYVRLGPGSLPNSSRYKIILRLWKDASNISPTPASDFNKNIIIECRGDTLGYTAAGFDDFSTTTTGGNTYPYRGLYRMMDPSVGFAHTSSDFYGRAKRQFIRDFQIANRSASDTLTVVTGAISSSNANNNTNLAARTKVPGYENPFYVPGSYPSAQYMANGYGYYNGWPVDASGTAQSAYGGYSATAPCTNGRLCVTSYVDSCTYAPSGVFTQYIEYMRVIDLPNIPGGYHLRYAFRARASKLLNVISYQTMLDSTGVGNVVFNQGYAVYARIPDIAQLDNSVHYVASTVPGFWSGNKTTITGFSSGYINNLGCSPSLVTVLGLANTFSSPVYTAYSTTALGTSLASNYTVVGIPASLKQLYIESGISIVTGTGINNPISSPSQIITAVPGSVSERVRNSSPKFISVPPLFICQYNKQANSIVKQNPKYFYNAADLDNDSLVYEFAHPLDAGNLTDAAGYVNSTGEAMFIGTWTGTSAFINGRTFNYNDPLFATTPYGVYPQNVNIATQNYIKFFHSYTYDQPMGTNSDLLTQGIILNSSTGEMTIQPTVKLGLYVVSVKAKEFRRMADGTRLFLGEIARDYMFNMLSCPLPAQALTTTTGSCNSSAQYLANSSTDAATIFYWDSGKDRYIMTTSIVGINTFTGIKRNLSRANNTTVLGLDAQVSNTVNQARSVVGGNLTPKNDAYFDFSVPGTYFVKLVVQGRGTKCADSVFQKVVVSTIAAGWFPTKAGSVCVNSSLIFSSYMSTISGTTISGSGITTISGSSLWTNPATNPIPMRPYTTVVGTNTISGFTNYKWMDGNKLTTTYTPPSPAEPSKLTHITWDFGDGTIQELTFNGSNFVAYPSLKNNVAIVYTIPGGPLSIPGVSYVYTTTGGASTKTYNVTQTVENQFGCSSSLTRSVTIIQAQPTASIIGANVCQNNPSVSVSGFITVATGGIWSGGTGAYLPATTMTGTSLSLLYKPTNTELSVAGNIIPIKLTTNGNGVCQAGLSSTTVGITVLAKPVVVAGSSFTVCGNNLSYTLSGSVTGGTFTGQWMTKGTGTFTGSQMNTSTILGDTYAISKADSIAGKVKLILTSTNNGICTAVSDSLTLTISPLSAQPKANAGSDFTVCSNNSNIPLSGTLTNVSTGGGVWSAVNSTASGTFGAGNATTSTTLSGTNAFYTPSAADTTAGYVKLLLQTTIPVSNGGCKNVTDTLQVTILSSPKINIDIKSNIPLKPFNACANNAVFTFTGTITGAGGGIWQITNPIGSGTFLPGSNPSAVAIGSNVNKFTTVYFPSAQEIAAANNPSSPGYDLGVRLISTVNGFCNSVKSGTIISLIPAPSVTISGASPISVCKNNSVIKLGSSTFFAPDIAWYSSSSGSFSGGNFIPDPSYISSTTDTSNGNVQIILSGTSIADNCKTVYDTLLVNYTNVPSVNAGANQTICENNLVGQLNGSVTAPASGGIWTAYGSGTFNSSGTQTSGVLNDTYFPSITDLNNGTVTFGLTTTGTNIGTTTGKCLPISQSTAFNFSAKPVINFGTVGSVNENNASVDLTVTVVGTNVTSSTFGIWGGGTGSYSPNRTNFTYAATSPSGLPVLVGKLTYVPSAAEILAKQVTLYVSVTGANNCALVMDTLTFPIFAKPTIKAFGSSVCANNALINLTGTVTGAAGGTWSGGTNPVNFSAPGFNATYTPTSAEINSGFVKLYFTTTGEYNNAKPERDSVVINITPAPVVSTGGNIVICGNAVSTTIAGSVSNAFGGVWTTSGSGSFSASTIAGASMNSTYFPSALDRTSVTPVKLTLTSVGNGGCIAVTDIMNLSFSAVPVANAGPGQIVCVNDFPVQLNASGSAGSWSNVPAGGKYGSTGNATSFSLIDTYTPSTIPGIIRLTWTTSTAGCLPVSDNMLLTVVSAPIVNLGPAVTVCGSNKYVGIIATVTGATGGVWRTSGTGNFTTTGSQIGNGFTDTYVLSTADINSGQVILTFTGSGTSPCSPVSATKIINITPAITVNVGPNQTLCAGSTTNISLSAQVLANGNVNTLLGGVWTKTSTVTGSYVGSTNALNAVFTPSSNDKNILGKIALIFTASSSGACISPVPDTITYTFTPSPVSSILGGNFSVCSDAGSIGLNATFSGAAGIIWSTSGTNLAANWSLSNTNTSVQYLFTQNEINAGKVSFVVQTNGSGVCANALSNIVNVTISGKPVVTAGPDINVCSNLSSFSLTGANITFAGSPLPSVYWFASTATATGGTFNNNTIIGFNGIGNNPIYTPTSSEIAGGTMALFVSVTGPGSCISQLVKRTITFTPAPTVSVGSPLQTFCSNTSVLTLTGSTTGSSSGIWTITTPGATGNSNISAITSTSSTYTLFAADKNLSVLGFVFTTSLAGCNPVSATKTINLSPAPMVQITQIIPIAGLKSVTFCGDAMTATFTGINTVTGAGLWSSNPSGTFSVNSATLPKVVFAPLSSDIQNAYTNNKPIKVYLTSDNNGVCAPAKDSVSIFYTAPPTLSAGTDTIVCSNNAVVSLTGLAKSSNIVAVQWSTSANSTLTGGMGTFLGSNLNNSTLFNESYIPGSVEKAAGSTVLMLVTTSITGGCQAISAQKNITYIKAPVINPMADQTVCANNSAVNCVAIASNYSGGYWTRSGVGQFSTDSTQLSAVYYPLGSDLVSGAVGTQITFNAVGIAPCATASKSFTLRVSTAPTLNVTVPGSICADAGTVNFYSMVGLSTTGVSWSNISSPGTLSGSFFSNSFVLNPQYMPSANDISKGYAVFNLSTTGNGTCNAAVTTVQMNILSKPVVITSGDQNICASATYGSQMKLVFTGVGFNTGQWVSNGTGTMPINQATSGNSVNYNVSTDDIDVKKKVTFIVTSLDQGLCNAVSAKYTVSFTGAPVIDPGIDNKTYCSNVGVITLSGSITGSDSYKYQWVPDDHASEFGTLTGTAISSINSSGVTSTVGFTNTFLVNGGGHSHGENNFGFSLVVTSSGICNAVYTTGLNANLEFIPEFILSGSPEYCEDATKINLSASWLAPSPSLNLIWSGYDGITTTGAALTDGQFSPSIFDENVSFFFSSADRTVSGVTFVVSTTGVSYCPVQMQSLQVPIRKKSLITATGTALVCSNQPVVTLTGFSNSGKGIWIANSVPSSAGTFTGVTNHVGSVGGVSGSMATYTVSGTEIINGFVKFIYQSDNNGVCGATSSTIGVNINQAPVVDAGNDFGICPFVPVTLTGTVSPPVTIAGGTFWSVASVPAGSSVSASISTINTTSGANIQNVQSIFSASTVSGVSSAIVILNASLPGCNLVSSSAVLTFVPGAAFDVGTYPNPICSSDKIKLKPGVTSPQGQWSTTASGYFLASGTNTTTKMDDIFVPNVTVSGPVAFVLSSLPGTGACGSPAPATAIITITGGMVASAGNSLKVSVCLGYNPVFVGTLTGTALGRWYTGGTGVFSSSGADSTYINNAIVTTSAGFTTVEDRYLPSDQDKQSGKVILTFEALNDGSNNCLTPVRDTLTISFTNKPKAISKSYSRLCGNVASQNGITITGVVRLYTPNDSSPFTVHDNGARWRLINPPTVLGSSINHSPTGFVLTSVGTSVGTGSIFANSSPRGFSEYTNTTFIGFQEITVNAVYYPTDYDLTRQYLDASFHADTLAMIIESAELASNTQITTLTGTSFCDPALDTLKIIFDKSPTASITGTNNIICADQNQITLNGLKTLATGGVWSQTGGSGQFLPDSAYYNVIYKLSAADKSNSTALGITFNYKTTGNGSCYPAQTNYVLTVNPKPDIMVSSDMIVCADASVITVTGTITGASPASYQWTTNGSNTLSGYVVNSVTGLIQVSTGYALSSTDVSFSNIQFTFNTSGPGSCMNRTKVVNLDINPLPSIVPSPDIEMCKDIDDISLSVTTQNVSTMQWAVLINGVTSTPGVGTFTGNGLSATGSVAGNNLVSVNYKLTANDRNADSLVFYISSLGATPNTSNPACNIIKKKITLRFTSTPVLALNTIAGICSDASSFNLMGTITGTLGIGGIWSSSGNGTFSPDNRPLPSTLQSSAYTYNLSQDDKNLSMLTITLAATDIGTCTKNYIQTQNVNIVPLPKVSTGGDTTVCSDAQTISFGLSTQTGAASIAWKSFGSGTFTGINNTLPGVWLYNRSAADSAAGQVTFELDANGVSPCGLVSDFRVVKFFNTPAISISAGLDQVICSDNTVINLNGSTDGVGAYWSAFKYPSSITGTNQQYYASGDPNAGRGVFRNGTDVTSPIDSNAINPSYFPSSEDTLGANANNSNQVISIKFTAYGNGSCANHAYSSYMKVTFTPRPNLYIPSVPPICDSDTRPVTILGFFLNSVAGSGLWTSTGGGQFSPGTISQNPPTVAGIIYYPDSSDRYVDRRVGIRFQPQNMGTCLKPLQDAAISLIINTSPGLNPGLDRTVCENASVVSFTGLVTGLTMAQWKSSGSGTFTSNSTSPGANLTVTGNSITDSYRPSGMDLLAGKINFLLKSIATTNNCPLDSARVSLSFDKIPQVTVGSDRTVCADVGVVSIAGTVANVSGGYWTALAPASGVFLPSATLLGTSYQLSASDASLSSIQFVLVSGSNQCQPVSSTAVTYFISPIPVANSGSPSVCTINGIPLHGRTSNSAFAYWKTNGTGLFSPSAYDTNALYYPSQNDIKVKGKVTLILVAAGLVSCDSARSSVTLNVGDDPIPKADAGRDDIVCRDGVFKLNVLHDTTAYTYVWLTNSLTGVGKQLVPIASANTLSVDVQLDKDSVFVLQVTDNGNKCVNMDSIKIQVITLPSLNLQPRVCYSDTLILPYNQAIPITKTEGVYQWYKDGVFVQGETSPKRIKATTPGDYTLEYTEFICSTRDTTNVRPLPLLNTKGKVICAGSQTSLTPNVLTINGVNTNLYAVDWALGYNSSMNGFNLSQPQPIIDSLYHRKTIQVIESRSSAKYLVAVTDTLYKLSCTAYDTVRVQTHPVPAMQLRDVSGCDNDVVTLDARPTNLQTPKIFTYPPTLLIDTINAVYNWSSIPAGLVKTPSAPKITVTQDGAGTYFATFTIGECIARDTSNVLFNAPPVVSNQSLVKYCVEDKSGITLDAGVGTDYKYLWLASGNTGRTEIVYDTLTYYFKVFNKAGCSVLDSILVKSMCSPKVYIPGAFIPDDSKDCSDLQNCDKYFVVRGKYFKSLKIKIYNRWGEIIFASESKDFAWDGTYNGVAQPLGVYPYVLEYESIYDDQKGIQTKRGQVTLVR